MNPCPLKLRFCPYFQSQYEYFPFSLRRFSFVHACGIRVVFGWSSWHFQFASCQFARKNHGPHCPLHLHCCVLFCFVSERPRRERPCTPYHTDLEPWNLYSIRSIYEHQVYGYGSIVQTACAVYLLRVYLVRSMIINTIHGRVYHTYVPQYVRYDTGWFKHMAPILFILPSIPSVHAVFGR